MTLKLDLDTPDFHVRRDRVPVVASGEFPVAWRIQVDEELGKEGFIIRYVSQRYLLNSMDIPDYCTPRIQWPCGDLAVELDDGNPVPGTRVRL